MRIPMLDQLKKLLFSTRLTAVLLFVFLTVLGIGTFLESATDTDTAQRLIYRTKWMEAILLLMTINLIGNIIKYKLYRKEKWSSFLFHISFIVIIIGAALTRYVGFEGAMPIREGEASSVMTSREVYFEFKVHDNVTQFSFSKLLQPNNITEGYWATINDYFQHKFKFKNQEISVDYKKYIPNSIDSLVPDPEAGEVLELVTVGHDGRVSIFLEEGASQYFGEYLVTFNNPNYTQAIQIMRTDSGLMVMSPYDINTLNMDTKEENVLLRDSLQYFTKRKLHTIGETQIVLKEINPNARIEKITSSEKGKGINLIIVDVTANENTREVYLFGGRGYASKKTIFKIDNLTYEMSYGSKYLPLPFSIRLNDFELEKYPGSLSPSSFSSRVTVVDTLNNNEFDHHIFMNNVLDYEGYRFFQSGFDKDELGTILSVNHDGLGTWVTYFGYFIMIFGMMFSLVTPKSRFVLLIKKMVKKEKVIKTLMLFAFLSAISINGIAQNDSLKKEIPVYEPVPAASAEKFGHLIIQDIGGRMKPMHSLASEILRKISRKSKWKGETPEQVILGFISNPRHWSDEKMIKIDNPQLEEELGAVDHFVSFSSFFDADFRYKFEDKIKEVLRHPEKDRGKYDKEILLVDERVNVIFQIFENRTLKLFPLPNDPGNKWYATSDFEKFEKTPALLVKGFLYLYLTALQEDSKTGDFTNSDDWIDKLDKYQKQFGAEVMPSKSKINMEVLYNKLQVFNRAFNLYFILSLVLLLLLFVEIFNKSKTVQDTVKFVSGLVFLVFVFHGIGLGMRWYIGGHAPWSNAYEVLIYISWTTVLAGFIFYRWSKFALAAATLLASLTLLVAFLKWLNPDIGTLVPVLKSYWLSIHVAVMSGSYGFLGLSAIIGLINIILYILLTNRNKKELKKVITELTIVNELTMTIGIFMAGIGTFLGGIWANESWGRYWGWDPKETWALIIVLAYAIFLHFRLIPGLKSKLTFNIWSLFGYSTILMTYFGVNYFLVGLHSYAGGTTPQIPTWSYWVVVVFIALSIIAMINKKKIERKKSIGIQ